MISTAIKNFLLKTADDSFILGHRNSEWTGFGPFLEEDIAFASMAQDKIGHAWAIYKMMNENGWEKNAEWLAFQRPESEFMSSQFVELPIGEYDFTLMRHFLFDEADLIRYELLQHSSFAPIAHLAKKIKGELKYHVMHAETFLLQLSKGNEEGKARMQSALNECIPYALGLFETYDGEEEITSSRFFEISESELKARWLQKIQPLLTDAGLKLPNVESSTPVLGGRHGYHSEHLQVMLKEMREVISLDPTAEW